MCQIQKADGGERTDQEDDIEPAVVEVELQVSENLRYDYPILRGHVHAYQENGRHKMHPLEQMLKIETEKLSGFLKGSIL